MTASDGPSGGPVMLVAAGALLIACHRSERARRAILVGTALRGRPPPWRNQRMARVLITGSSDGLGLMAGELLARGGHEVTLHARNDARAGDAPAALPAAAP